VSGRLVIALTLGIFSTGSFGQTLKEAVEITLRTNPDIIASKYNVDAAAQLRRQAQGGLYPSVDLVLAGGRENSNNVTNRATGSDDLRLTRKERSLRLTQLLYDGFSTTSLIDQQTALTDAAVARLTGTQESVSLRAIQVYLEVLRRESVVELTKVNLAHHDNTLSKIQERFDNGIGTKVDVVQTQGRQAQSKSNVLLAQRDARNGVAEFYRVVGENPNNLTKPAEIAGIPTTLEQAIEVAMLNNPNLVAAKSELDAAVAGHKQARSAYHPRFDLELGATRNDDNDGTPGANDDETVVVRMSYNLYRGGADKARINEAQAREFAARETVRSVQRSVAEDVTLVWNELDDILVRLQYLEAHVKATEEVLEVYNQQLSLGKRTLLDLLDVQNELLRANVAYLTGQYTAILARYRVLASTGRLLDTMVIDADVSVNS
jgi:adhesin transport system outer membrane protein